MFGKQRMEALRTQIEDHLKAARAITDRAEAEGRNLTADESRAIDEKLKAADALKPEYIALRRDYDNDMRLKAQLTELTGPPDRPSARRGDAWAKAVLATGTGTIGAKAFAPSGATVVAVPAPIVAPLGQPVANLRSVLASEPTGGAYSFLRQTVRTSNAAPVAQGALKPTSVYTVELVEDRARTIAHLSEPIPRQVLADASALADFLGSEMIYGLEKGLEAQILTGDGTGENLTGLSHTSGVQTQAYSTSVLVTTRKAVTKLESQGLAGDAWVFNPADWESVELLATTTGALLATEAGGAAPIETVARRLWSRPVVTSTACPAGTAWFGDFGGSAKLFVREEAVLDWSQDTYDPDALGTGVGASDFSRNLVRYRVEGRFGFGVLRPSGFVSVDLTP